jgi:hypothetical protein
MEIFGYHRESSYIYDVNKKIIKVMSEIFRVKRKDEIRLIINTIKAFDEKNPIHRFKSYDVYDHKGEIFVEYVNQCDYTNDGKQMLKDLLSNFKYPIYLHYIVRDDYNVDNIDSITKKGFELI